MCAVSNIGDDFTKKWPNNPANPWKDIINPNPIYPMPGPWTPGGIPNSTQPFNSISREEFNALKKEIEELKKALLVAKKEDEAAGNPDCEMEDKVALLKKIAEVVGVDLSEIFDRK